MVRMLTASPSLLGTFWVQDESYYTRIIIRVIPSWIPKVTRSSRAAVQPPGKCIQKLNFNWPTTNRRQIQRVAQMTFQFEIIEPEKEQN